MIGSTISHYKIPERTGSGPMEEVCKAEDLMHGSRVALKFLNIVPGSHPRFPG